MKILVLVVAYPDNNGAVDLMYVHTRNCYYIKHNIDVTVLNFSATHDYVLDGIKVICPDSYSTCVSYDKLVLHASNLRNHYRFLKKYEKNFPELIFFYHGHEVVKINKIYPKPFDYVHKHSFIRRIAQDAYDSFKLTVWRHYIPKIAYKSQFIFVSDWMKREFFKWTRVPQKLLIGRSHVIYNNIDVAFEMEKFETNVVKKYDFITIRGYIDGAKYCIDVVNRLAWNTPDKQFLVIGKGDFFKYNKKAPNLTWKNIRLPHSEIVRQLNASRFALMPTRTDSQGLMMCEMAAFGIPVITSDIPVCHDVFGNFENVYYIDNDNEEINLDKFDESKSICIKHKEYYASQTVNKEVFIIGAGIE